MRNITLKNYFDEYNKIAVLMISIVFSFLVGGVSLNEYVKLSEQNFTLQIQVIKGQSKSILDFVNRVEKMQGYQNISTHEINPLEVDLKAQYKLNGNNVFVLNYKNKMYFVEVRHSLFADFISKMLITILFSLFGSYYIVKMINKAKVDSLNIQLQQVTKSIENLAYNKKKKVSNSEVLELKEMQGLVAEADSDLKAEIKDLSHKAERDSLTGLYNKRMFDERLEELEIISFGEQKQVGLLYLDLNDFKPMNDTYGHEFGDKVLIAFSEILKSSIRGEDEAFRLGGDEFAVIVKDVNENRGMAIMRSMLARRINKNITISGINTTMSSSIGMATYPLDVSSIPDLVTFADKNMYEQKSISKSSGVTRIEEKQRVNYD